MLYFFLFRALLIQRMGRKVKEVGEVSLAPSFNHTLLNKDSQGCISYMCIAAPCHHWPMP